MNQCLFGYRRLFKVYKKNPKLVIPMPKTIKERKEVNRSISTGDWDILNGKRIRRWPGGSWSGYRCLTVKIDSWVGISMGATHTYLNIKEEDNSWWCEEKDAWVNIYGDNSGTGMRVKADLLSTEDCINLTIPAILCILARGKADGYEHRISLDCESESIELELIELLKKENIHVQSSYTP